VGLTSGLSPSHTVGLELNRLGLQQAVGLERFSYWWAYRRSPSHTVGLELPTRWEFYTHDLTVGLEEEGRSPSHTVGLEQVSIPHGGLRSFLLKRGRTHGGLRYMGAI
jgi:hypothetical protein